MIYFIVNFADFVPNEKGWERSSSMAEKKTGTNRIPSLLRFQILFLCNMILAILLHREVSFFFSSEGGMGSLVFHESELKFPLFFLYKKFRRSKQRSIATVMGSRRIKILLLFQARIEHHIVWKKELFSKLRNICEFLFPPESGVWN